MVAREEKLVLVEQHHMAARVAGDGDNPEFIVKTHLAFALYDVFYAAPSSAVSGVHHTTTTEFFGERDMIRYVVLMRKKHCSDAAHPSDALDKRPGEAWAINQHIAAFAFRPHDQVAPRAEAGFRGVAAEVNVVGQVGREGVNADAHVMFARRADGGGRASH